MSLAAQVVARGTPHPQPASGGSPLRFYLELQHHVRSRREQGSACIISDHTLRACIAVSDITLPLGYRMCGYFHERLSTAVKDPLLAKAVVFEQRGTSG